MTESKEPDRVPTDLARRNLVRGAFAAPAVLALHSGGASAATSSLNCVANQNKNPVTFPWTASDDTYFRYRLWVIRKKTDLTINSAWIKGADLTVYIRNNQLPFVGTTSWRQFALSTNALYPSDTATAPSPNGSENPLEQTGPWVIIRVNATGGLAGAGTSGSGSALADSCWSSFLQGTPP